MIHVSKITKQFKNGNGVFDVSFDIDEGTVMGYIGANGAGKSTTIRQIMGFVKPEKGKIKVNDLNSWKCGGEVRNLIGYLPGEVCFPESLTPMDIIKMQAELRNNYIDNLNRARKLIDLLELNVKVPIRSMSKGMKQKVAIICAFMADCKILILDEPSSGLDPIMQDVLIKLINHEKNNGKTILLSSHIFEEVKKTADKITIIKKGRIQKSIDVHSELDDLKKYLIVKTSDQIGVNGEIKLKNNTYKVPINDQNINQVIKQLSTINIQKIDFVKEDLEDKLKKLY